MSRIIRTEASPVFSAAVEYHNFVFLQGVTADDFALDVTGQTRQVLARIDALLDTHGTDNTRLLQAQIWLKNITDRAAMNAVWTEWLPAGGAPARACVQAEMVDPRILVEIMVVACK